MKKLSLYLLVVCSFVIITSTILFKLCNEGLRRVPFEEFGKLNEIMAGTTPYDLLIMGNSRSLLHVSPYILDSALHTNAYNMGTIDGSLNADLALLHAYLDHHDAPRYLLMNFDWWLPTDTLIRNEPFDYPKFYPYLDNKWVKKYLIPHSPQMKKVNTLPFLGLINYDDYKRTAALRGWTKSQRTVDVYKKGYFNRNAKFTGKDPKDTPPMKDCTFSDEGIRELDELFTLCNEKNITIFVFIAPGYRINEQLKVRQQDRDQLQQLMKLRHVVFFQDYSLRDEFLAPSWYCDAHHLNKEGAEYFSRIIAHEIEGFIHQ